MADNVPRPYIRTARADRRSVTGGGRTAQVEGAEVIVFHVRSDDEIGEER